MIFVKPQKMLGPSQVSVVLGYSPFLTASELRLRMEHGYEQDMTNEVFKEAGCKDEPRCRKLYTATYGLAVTKCPFVKDSQCRFGGYGDGLIGKDGGLEIKCQYNKGPVMYFEYKVQAVAYMFLYKRQWWDIMVCHIDRNTDTADAIVERLYWKDYEQVWGDEWYPKIKEFCGSVKWTTTY